MQAMYKQTVLQTKQSASGYWNMDFQTKEESKCRNPSV